MMHRTLIKEVLAAKQPAAELQICGWVRTRRDAKTFSFLELNDGSCWASLQVIADASIPEYAERIPRLGTGSAVRVRGELVKSTGKGQDWELHAAEVEVLGWAEESFPLQKKRHSREFLREIAHLRPRTNLFGAIFRLRSRMAFAVHQFFQDREFIYVHTPIITASDCEGAGEMFRVTTLGGDLPSQAVAEQDFFGRPTYLTVSGQLEGEIFACALGNIYTFGPTFRAENSNTSRHAAEFWMIEPEMAFCDLFGDMDLAEEMVKYLIRDALNHCEDELAFFNQFVDKELLGRLQVVLDKPFARLSYSDAVKILTESGKTFEYPVEWGVNLQAEHERFLCEEHIKGPLTLHDYPKAIKPFYMRENKDGQTVAAMDVLVPSIGEIVGGSQREERLDLLRENFKEHDLNEEDYWWYLDLRRFGTVPHAGFGLGFERLLMLISGVENIRDVIPFPRTPRHAEF